MGRLFSSVAIFGRQYDDNIAPVITTLVRHLVKHNINIVLDEELASIFVSTESTRNLSKEIEFQKKSSITVLPKTKLPNNCELIIVIGGDGSLLNAVHTATNHDIPLLGINRGYLGFLTDISPQYLAKIDNILTGKYTLEQRFLLQTYIQHNQHIETLPKLSLNDVVLLSTVPGNMVEFSVSIDEQFMCSYRADGIIISTPTGSTAHALSAGGPILHPNLEAIVLTPICSHNLSSRPIVLKSTAKIKLTIPKTNTKNLAMSCDGQERIEIMPETEIYINQAQQTLKLLHPLDYNYFETLRTKLNWEIKPTIN